jgi:hypothetical protein
MAKYWIAIALTVWATAAEAVPAYKIVSEDIQAGSKSISVRIDGRLNEADLASLADTLQRQKAPDKTALLVKYYLPAMPLNDAPWAVVHYAPNRNVTINGLRLDEEEAFRAKAESDPRNLVGVWLTSPPAVPGKLTIWRETNRNMYAEWQLRNGTKTIDQLVETRSQRGRRYNIVGADGGYYLGLWNGSLELGDQDSVIAIAERLKFEKSKVPLTLAVSARAPANPALPSSPNVTGVNATAGPSTLASAAAASDTPPLVIPKPARRKPKSASLPKVDLADRSVREMLEASLGK